MAQNPESKSSAAQTLKVGLAGLGFMGSTHLKAWREVPAARLVAVMDSDAKKLTGDLTSVGGNFGGGGEKVDFSGLRTYQSLEDMLADPNVDAVDLCLPTNEHGKAAVAALRAGKHTMVEKPMALTEAETGAVLKEAQSSGRTLMVGQILRFLPSYSALRKALQASGPVRSAAFRRRCAAPTWSLWLTDPSLSGGGIFDLLIHDVDYCVSIWGLPEAVRAVGYEDLAHGIDVVHAELQYPSVGAVTVSGGWHHASAYPFSMDFTVVTEGSTFEWSSVTAELAEYGNDGKKAVRELPTADAFADELAYFADCAINKRRPERCLPEQSAQSVALMLKIIESRKKRGEVVPCES
jgi:predicted dehydrogenase